VLTTARAEKVVLRLYQISLSSQIVFSMCYATARITGAQHCPKRLKITISMRLIEKAKHPAGKRMLSDAECLKKADCARF